MVKERGKGREEGKGEEENGENGKKKNLVLLWVDMEVVRT